MKYQLTDTFGHTWTATRLKRGHKYYKKGARSDPAKYGWAGATYTPEACPVCGYRWMYVVKLPVGGTPQDPSGTKGE